MTKNQKTLLGSLVLVAIVFALGARWLNRGYGEVDAQTYEYSKAIFSACLTRNEEHLGRVEELLASDQSKGLPANERFWLEAMVEKARDGNWEIAAKKARRMMEDQVAY